MVAFNTLDNGIFDLYEICMRTGFSHISFNQTVHCAARRNVCWLVDLTHWDQKVFYKIAHQFLSFNFFEKFCFNIGNYWKDQSNRKYLLNWKCNFNNIMTPLCLTWFDLDCCCWLQCACSENISNKMFDFSKNFTLHFFFRWLFSRKCPSKHRTMKMGRQKIESVSSKSKIKFG